MNLLRLITPEEIGDIATKHSGGKFLSLTTLVSERFEHQVYRDFSSIDSLDEIHSDHHSAQAKILPFKKPGSLKEEVPVVNNEEAIEGPDKNQGEKSAELEVKAEEEILEHKENENMSSFILIEKERLKRSQYNLKQKEIIDLYNKNSAVDVEQIKGSNNNLSQAKEAGVLVNKKQY